MRRLYGRGAAVHLLGAVLSFGAVACDDDGGATGRSETPSPTAGSASGEPSAPAAAPVWESLEGPLARCGPQSPEVLDAGVEAKVLRDPEVGRIPAAQLGQGRTALVLLHQTNGNGLCGWLPFLPVAAEAGFAVLAIDLCRYGESECRAVASRTFEDADQTDAVELAMAYARSELGARDVVVMGASMGGSIALMSGATLAGLTAIVDLSGPLDWPGAELARGGRALQVPALVAMGSGEGAEAVEESRLVAERAPEGSVFLNPEGGHGYTMLTDADGMPLDLAYDVLDWVLAHASPSR